MTIWKKTRALLALPAHLLAGLTMLLSVILFGKFPRLLDRAYRGSQIHVYMPLVRLRRLIEGTPTWQPIDCIHLDIQPRTEEEKARANACKDLGLYTCDCKNPDCMFKTPRYMDARNQVVVPEAIREEVAKPMALPVGGKDGAFCQLCAAESAPYDVCKTCFAAALRERDIRPGGGEAA